jgi:hypothetical protein
MDEQPRRDDAPGLANDLLGDGQSVLPAEELERRAEQDDGPDIDELDDDPAYNPRDPMLRRLKGG